MQASWDMTYDLLRRSEIPLRHSHSPCNSTYSEDSLDEWGIYSIDSEEETLVDAISASKVNNDDGTNLQRDVAEDMMESRSMNNSSTEAAELVAEVNDSGEDNTVDTSDANSTSKLRVILFIDGNQFLVTNLNYHRLLISED